MHFSKAGNALSEFSDPYSEGDWPLEYDRTTDPMFDSASEVRAGTGAHG